MKIFPASYHQERLWFIDNFEKGILYSDSPVYHNLPLIVQIAGLPDAALLAQSMATLAEQYDLLRTNLILHNEHIVQVVQDSLAEVPLATYTLAENCTETERAGLWNSIIQHPFKLDAGPLWRIALINHGGTCYLVFTAHHIIADRRTMQLWLNTLATQYTLLTKGQALQTPAHTSQFADFATWQKDFTDEMLEQFMLFWRSRLGKIQPLNFYTDREREKVHVYEAALKTARLEADLSRHISASAHNHYDIFLTAFHLLLAQYAQQQEIVTGIISENRHMEGLEQMTGPVANLVVLKNEVSRNQSIAALLSQIQESRNQALEYADIPFDKLVTCLNPEKDMSRTALFDVLFQYEERGGEGADTFGNMPYTLIETNQGLGKYDYNLLVVKEHTGYHIYFTYNQRYYDAATADRLLAQYQAILTYMQQNEDCRVSELPNMPDAARHLLLQQLDKTHLAWPQQESILSLFHDQVSRYPANTAVVFKNWQCTYTQLNSLANQLASYLKQKHHISQGHFVALLLPRNQWQIIAILAVLKCGAAYVPIDPDYPEERIQFIRHDCDARLCIDTALIADFEQQTSDNHLQHPPQIVPSSESIAYVIYTSGSTGMPKGVQVTHGNVVRLFRNEQPLFDFNDKDVWTMFHSYCFDFSVWEMYGALLFGGKVIVIAKNVAAQPEAFLEILVQHQVTVLNQTPAAFYNLLHIKPWLAAPQVALRRVIFGGDKLHPARLRDWHQHYPGTRLINMYGITETTVHVTYKEIGDVEIASGISNIGTPIPTLSCYVLDEHGNILPPLVPGELWIGGAGVSAGYLNRPELTAEKFIANPFGPGLLYRSGDAARVLSSGELEYIGRLDNQVKIRGFRIETGEVEKALLQHTSINEAVVLAIENQQSEKELAAYFTANTQLTAGALRLFLKNILPDHMVPAHFIQVDRFLLNSNGKTDKTVLPRPQETETSTGTAYIAPQTDTEQKLVAIWQEILNKTNIGVADDFFVLGGDSLKVSRVMNRVNEVFDTAIPLKNFFVNSTIANLAHLIELDQWFNQEPAQEADQNTTIRI